MNQNKPQPLTRNHHLTLKDLETLSLPLIIQDNQITIKMGLRNYPLKHPVTIELEKVLAVKELKLIEYVFEALLCERPVLLQYTFNNKSVLLMARHFLRNCSGSPQSCYTYIQHIHQYTTWLGSSPDQIIADLKTETNTVDPQRLVNHNKFVDDYVAALQDRGLTNSTINNHLKACKIFYKTNDIKIEFNGRIRRKTIYKDRAPTPEELTKLLDVGNLREKTIVTMLALGGFREGTLSKLKYRHVKDDLENNIIPIHIHVEETITKGKYGDYDTFLGAEATQYLKLYLNQRQTGTKRIPPETLTDESPLIRATTSQPVSPIGSKQITQLVHQLYVKAGLTKHKQGHYDLRTHSLRKYFKTQMIALGCQSDYVDYFMGHVLDTYHSIQSIGLERLRSAYSAAGLSIRTKTQMTDVDQVKQLIRALGGDPSKWLSKEMLTDGAITVQNAEDQQLAMLRERLKQLIIAQKLV
ncbi:site-specific integrase [Candidatus Bathycorpusculum sp.]|uniref:tyrosine-type recombinase/integrase n=1 Tax=Candidatus Bathycorpusculum sp. TaxID=2994959 RepID=UPI00282375B1|nr:site-specific integrase [Candidatus Termitimicrobium sp.]MCL2686885.1 site-specific integrase [Candidatus Termitimicrobium sp.]